jgi:hypothetical protein
VSPETPPERREIFNTYGTLICAQNDSANGTRAGEGVKLGCRSGLALLGEPTTSLDREVKATPEREVRVGIYTSMRADCTADPLPAIRLTVAPEHGAVTVRRATLKATNNFQPWSRSIGLNRIPPTTIGLNWR